MLYIYIYNFIMPTINNKNVSILKLSKIRYEHIT